MAIINIKKDGQSVFAFSQLFKIEAKITVLFFIYIFILLFIWGGGHAVFLEHKAVYGHGAVPLIQKSHLYALPMPTGCDVNKSVT